MITSINTEKKIKDHLCHISKSAILLIYLFYVLYSGTILCSCQIDSNHNVTIYGEGCYSCFTDYILELRNITSTENQIRIEYLGSNPIARQELESLLDELSVPERYRGSVVLVIDKKYLFVNYVSLDLVSDFMINYSDSYDYFIAYWDELEANHKIINDNGKLFICEYDSLTDCVEPNQQDSESDIWLILSSGLLDGINPCAFTVLVFMITILQTIQSMEEDKENLALIFGAIYILSVFFGYLSVGLALFYVIQFSGIHKWLLAGGALLSIVLGLVNVKDAFQGNKPHLGIPPKIWTRIRSFIRKATLPAAVITGLTVSIVEFPCTGGVYLSIIGLLASEKNYWIGLSYLIYYNIAFVFPLIIILVFYNLIKKETFSFIEWNKNEKILRIFSGLFFIALGIYLLTAHFM